MTQPEPAPLIADLGAPGATLALVGGKALSLSRLLAAELPVPAGFVLTTHAYRAFVRANAIAASSSVAPDGQAASALRSRFESGAMPPELDAALRGAYEALGAVPAAVRSSATAEDLPGLSFAGQQDTFLNVRGADALLLGVRRCWASLWSERAISYRRQMGVRNRDVAMAVIVQAMVDADVSGVLFTANPVSGERGEAVINASYGLGESIVSGRVDPDTYVVDRASGHIKTVSTGGKALRSVPTAAGTSTVGVPEGERSRLSLTEGDVTVLLSLAHRAERLLGQPQDIEWVIADHQPWLVQSRPITGLPAAPVAAEWRPPSPNARLVRRQVVENMPEPLSPLFEELYLTQGLQHGMEHLLDTFGIAQDLTRFLVPPWFATVNGYGYFKLELTSLRQAAIPYLKMVAKSLYLVPRLLSDVVPRWRDEGLPVYLASIERWQALAPEAASDAKLLEGIRELAQADATYWFYAVYPIGFAKITDGLLNWFLNSPMVSGSHTSGEYLSGFPSKTLEAHDDLVAIARAVRADPVVHHLVSKHGAGELLREMQTDAALASLKKRLAAFVDAYGHQGYNLDFLAPTQAEDPRPVLLSLKALADEPARLMSPQPALAAQREALIRATIESLWPIPRRIFRKLLAWAQDKGPYREQALFYLGAAWPTLRALAAELGRRLTAAGSLETAEDVYFLHSAEIEAACQARAEGQARAELGRKAAERRALREARKALHPPARVPQRFRLKLGPFDLTRFWEVWETQKLNAPDTHTLVGFAVSPGTAAAPASVIRSPEDFELMVPGSVLVCPTTTPAWTPLFAQASALVTDIGGILAHGSIVAREYGIPAVLGTGNATQRISNGQIIEVDGGKGTVALR